MRSQVHNTSIFHLFLATTQKRSFAKETITSILRSLDINGVPHTQQVSLERTGPSKRDSPSSLQFFQKLGDPGSPIQWGSCHVVYNNNKEVRNLRWWQGDETEWARRGQGKRRFKARNPPPQPLFSIPIYPSLRSPKPYIERLAYR
jgi:hypothetical protein